MPTRTDFSVRLVDWRDFSAVLSHIRTVVFVGEQQVPPELEMDGRDGECVHVLAESSQGSAIGTGRLMADGRIGRMAVLGEWRGSGVGGAMLRVLMEEAKRRGFGEVYLHSQSHARDFYLRHGFVAEGEEYEEAGIPHIAMRASL
jgi:predicted GNAT family N-acyltransferase